MYKRQFITAEYNSKFVSYKFSVGLKHSVLRTASVVDEFYFEETENTDDSKKSFSVCDPLIMLFNQERLENLGESCAKSFLDALAQKEPSLAELRKKCSDDDLVKMMKSRYLQTPSEVTAWCRYIGNNVDSFTRELALVTGEHPSDTDNVNNETSNT